MKLLVWAFIAFILWYLAQKLWDLDQSVYDVVDKEVMNRLKL
jgi:hypothetical protein